MSVGEGINGRVGPLLFGAVAIALGVVAAYFLLGQAHFPKVALLAVLFLSGVVAKLAGEVMAIGNSLHERVARLERRGTGAGPGRPDAEPGAAPNDASQSYKVKP